MHRKLLKADFFWPLSGLTVISVGLLVVTAAALAGRFDETVRDREQIIVKNGFSTLMEDAAKRVVPQAAWDDAVRNLDNHFDLAWARDNIGGYLRQVNGFQWSAVLDPTDNPEFLSETAPRGKHNHFSALSDDVASVVKSVRAEEARRGPMHARAGGEVIAAPIQASALTVHDGELQLLTATLVQPDFGRATLRGPRAPIVLTGLALDETFFADFASRFMLEGLHNHFGDAGYEPYEAHFVLTDGNGRTIHTIDWIPQKPGAELLRKATPAAALVLLLLLAAMVLLYRRSRRIAQGLIASEARASHLAYHDALTGLPNRVLFFDRLGHAIAALRHAPDDVAVFCLDLDRFKEVNDTYGHQAGDLLIAEAARRMVAACAPHTVVARLSGDEFAIVVSQATLDSASALAARLCEVMLEPFELGSGRAYVGCTIGVSIVGEAGIEPAEALRQADLALYRAKQTEKGWHCFYEPEMDRVLQTRRALEVDLREALARGAIEMAYQPQVNGYGVMIGVEALVRWRHPERGEIPPSYFVPIAEECGLIAELGMFTLRRAFIDSRRWGRLKVAVNVSATQLRMSGFVDELTDLAEELQVDPGQFELEITEGILLGDDTQTHDTLRRLRALGFSLALDDFGTGYSSLSYLKRYPINKIKIDRSFIASLGADAESEAVVAAIVKLARALHLSVIAEGVETPDQRDRLAAAGCSEVQGYLYGRPSLADQIDRLRQTGETMLEHAA